MTSERVLICGAGVSGSICAYFLAKHGYNVTVIERSGSDQSLGQGIEIGEPALEVVRQMGVLEKLEKLKTGELGFELVNQHSISCGKFGVGRLSPTGALELMRGDIVSTLYHAADALPNVTYRFETTIQSLSQTDSSVEVVFSSRATSRTITETFDLVIGADGQRSRTRSLVFGPPEEIKCYKPIHSSSAYFSIPSQPHDWPLSRLCHFPGGRIICLRPRAEHSDTTSVYLVYINADPSSRLSRANAAQDRDAQKAALAEVYADCGWETKRVLEGIKDASNFYSEDLMQVRLPAWHKGRVALVGDAAWAPTPFTGEGNQLAIIGAWVLAQELGRRRGPEALAVYEKRLRAHVEEMQQIPMGGYAPNIFNPQTSVGIWVLRNVVWSVSLLMRFVEWAGVLDWFPEKPVNYFDLEVREDGDGVANKGKTA